MQRIVGRRARSEDGAALVLALVFLAVFGVLIGILLGQVTVNLKTTPIVQSRIDRTYAADAAVEQGIQLLRLDPTKCYETASETLPPTNLNGRNATLTCKAVGGTGFSPGALGWAAVVRGDLSKQGGGQATISGPVFVAGSISASGGDVVVEGGSVLKRTAPCSGAISGLTVRPTPPYSLQCTSQTTPDPAHVLPPAPTANNPVPATPSPGCRVFFPGRYSVAPALLARNYFVSGTYYFEDIGTWITTGEIVGGFNSEDANPLNACVADPAATDATPGSNGSGFGVQWIFGGTSRLAVSNNDRVVLHARVPGPDAPSASRGISFQAVASPAPAGYKVANPSGPVLDAGGGQPLFTSYGLIYAPDADVTLGGPVGTSVVPNGIVAHDLFIKLSASSPGSLVVGLGTSPSGRRLVELTARASSAGEADVVSQAVVEVRYPTNPPTIEVRSWRTNP